MLAVLRNSVTLAASVLALASAGCSFTSTCSRDEDTVVVSDGLVLGNTYVSSPSAGPFAHFPPARTIEFVHGLPSYPTQIESKLAFSEFGTLAPAAGNSAIEIPPTNEEEEKKIRIKNDTCSEFYIRVQASVPVYPDLGNAGAGASGTDPLSSAGAAGTE